MSVNQLKIRCHHIAPKYLLTLLAGFIANNKITWLKNKIINRFIRQYSVDMSEAFNSNPTEYACFNDFFIRHLKQGCRPLANASVVSPVDGTVSQIGSIAQGNIIQAKAHNYTVNALLAHDPLSIKFENGAFATFYLSPKDYHRIHMPITGNLTKMVYVPGKLYSVQPLTVDNIPNLFAKNERLIAFFDTALGPMAMVLVGATIVGSIATAWHGVIKRYRKITTVDYPVPLTLEKGEEMGYFKLGSTVVLLFAHGNKLSWDDSIDINSAIKYGEGLVE